MKLTVEFDNMTADWLYTLEDDGKRWQGNLNWARKIALHYNLPLPETE